MTAASVTPIWHGSLIRTPKGGLVNVPANAITILAHDEPWKDVLVWDELALGISMQRPPPWFSDDATSRAWTASDEWSDADTLRTQSWLQRRWDLKLGLEAVWGAVRIVAERRVVHPVRDYLDGLRWDGVRRLPTWLPTCFGGDPSPYAELVGPWFLIGAVARVYRPGCKLDTMLILEGAQGAMKSTAMRALFSPWFADTPFDLESKDRFLALRGVWGVEIAELDSFRRADANRIKSFLSSPIDRYRPPYGRADIVAPRSCVLVGTTNAKEYLPDPTGNRRFWPWRCSRIDLERLRADRDQLWAEAREAYRSGAAWWPEPEHQAALGIEQQRRAHVDVWQDAIGSWLADRQPGAIVTATEVLAKAVHVEIARQGRSEQMRASSCILAAGWEHCRASDAGRTRGYRRPVVGPDGSTSGVET